MARKKLADNAVVSEQAATIQRMLADVQAMLDTVVSYADDVGMGFTFLDRTYTAKVIVERPGTWDSWDPSDY